MGHGAPDQQNVQFSIKKSRVYAESLNVVLRMVSLYPRVDMIESDHEAIAMVKQLARELEAR